MNLSLNKGLATVAALLALLLLALGAPAPAGTAADQASAACLQCHAAEGLEDGGGRDLGPHAGLSCQACHQGVAEYPHSDPALASCLSCHDPHNEEATGDLHAGVSCQACHWGGQGGPHALAEAGSEASCRQCHFAGNSAGAPAAVLPPKSVLCLACHTATISLSDWPSRLALAVLVLGLLGSLGFWLSGSGAGPAAGLHHAWRVGPALGALILDGLLQRRLWRLSPGRWAVHALIFLPMAARLAWALTALILGRWDPAAGLTQAMLAKNHPATALFFDLSGLLVLAGAILAALRRLARRGAALPGLPRPDWPAMALLLLVVISGFITEAARMALTGATTDAPWAFGGAALAGLFTPGAALQTAYAYLWYGHAICWAAFVAYLPFSRMRHILLAPLWLALKARGGHGQGK